MNSQCHYQLGLYETTFVDDRSLCLNNVEVRRRGNKALSHMAIRTSTVHTLSSRSTHKYVQVNGVRGNTQIHYPNELDLGPVERYRLADWGSKQPSHIVVGHWSL